MIAPFPETLARHGLALARGEALTLQVNTGPFCNMLCRHCHLEAGPHRGGEVMSEKTAAEIIRFARAGGFRIADITGGAPELTEALPILVEGFSESCEKVMLRSNLTALAADGRAGLIDLLIAKRVAIVASLPSTNAAQTDAQRGGGALEKSLDALKMLNSLGYGLEGSGLELNLVANPGGAFPPAPQIETEAKFRRDLERKCGIRFNNLYTFANVPLGRFRRWLDESGNLDEYLKKLAGLFNPCAVDGLMCRSQLSISWEGFLYDCDFNQAAGLPLGGAKIHVTRADTSSLVGKAVFTGLHCYACTAGSGFT